mmetsp:Transcript_19467/g.59991  ORF Transcript_19467/g.59991 Transcript_19467/m.59991 type:complete len:102 (+) Transcript_19467:60-365(+)
MNAARMVARRAPALARTSAPRRPLSVLESMATPVSNMPNKISEYRKVFIKNPHLHGADDPTYLKGSEDKVQCLIGAALVGFAMLQVSRGLYCMANGVGKNS